jgi:hypothetical protein
MNERTFRHVMAWFVVALILGGFFVVFAGPA